VASYLQTLCLVESFRTSFDDLLSLASTFSGDIRRVLLTLQVWLETGSTCRQKVAAPLYRPNDTDVPVDDVNDDTSCSISTRPTGTSDTTKPSESQSVDSGDEFVKVRTRKRRALRTLSSSDEESQSQSHIDIPISTVPIVDDTNSCDGSSSVTTTVNNCELSTGVAGNVTGMATDQLPFAMEATLAPPIHRLDFAAIGGLESLPQASLSKLQVCDTCSRTTNCFFFVFF